MLTRDHCFGKNRIGLLSTRAVTEWKSRCTLVFRNSLRTDKAPIGNLTTYKGFSVREEVCLTPKLRLREGSASGSPETQFPVQWVGND